MDIGLNFYHWMKTMKAKLEFDLPEDEYAFKIASSAQAMKDAIFTFDQYLYLIRNTEKHGNHKTEVGKLIEDIRKEFHETFEQWLND